MGHYVFKWFRELCEPLEEVTACGIPSSTISATLYDRGSDQFRWLKDNHRPIADLEMWCISELIHELHRRLDRYHGESILCREICSLPVDLTHMVLTALTPPPTIHKVLRRLSDKTKPPSDDSQPISSAALSSLPDFYCGIPSEMELSLADSEAIEALCVRTCFNRN